MSPLTDAQSASGAHNGRRMEAELETLRNRIKIERTRTSQEDAKLLNDMEVSLIEARERAFAAQKSKAKRDEYLRRCRLEVNAARASFQQDVKRHEALFKSSEGDRARRRAEAEKRTDMPRTFYVVPPGGGRADALSTSEQARLWANWESAFATFEVAPSDAAYGLDDVPWPPPGCPVSGARRGDSEEEKHQRLKHALLRWHPDKFLGRHGPKLLESAVPQIMERVSATFQRVQAERNGLEVPPAKPQASERGPTVYASRATTPPPKSAMPAKVVRPSKR
eukprot:7381887-Prymnesium_polylepis.1